MTSLLDIGPLTETISVIGDKSVTVYGLTPEGFFELLTRHPELVEMKTHIAAAVKTSDFNAIREIAPKAIATAIALVTTDRSRYASQIDFKEAIDAASKIATSLGVHVQAKIVNAAIRLTLPEGLGPFEKEMVQFASTIATASASGTEASGLVSDTTLQPSSRRGFVVDSHGMRLGPASRSARSTH